MYGQRAWEEHNGFTAAQGSLNLLETAGYVAYLWVVWRQGEGRERRVGGGWGGVACLVGFALSVMTVSKTVLYCEYSLPDLAASLFCKVVAIGSCLGRMRDEWLLTCVTALKGSMRSSLASRILVTTTRSV